MDKIFERLANLAKSFFNDLVNDDPDGSGTKRRQYVDPDEQAAWDELNDFLDDEESSSSSSSSRGREYRQQYAGNSGRSTPDSEMQQAFKNLEVPFGTPFDKVKKAYKTLLKKYHPDRYANDPEKFKFATEYTKKINESFDRIEKYYQKK